jgi:hypothetical protein
MPDPTAVRKATADAKDKATRQQKDKVLGRETLVMPVRLYFVTSVARPEDALEPAPCQLWQAGDIDKIAAVANSVTAKLGLALKIVASNGFVVPSRQATLFHENTEFAGQQQQFSKILGYGVRNGQVNFDPGETYILFLGRVHKDDPGTATARGLTLDYTDRKRAFELGGNKIVIGYSKSAASMPASQADRACTVTGARLPNLDSLGIVLAHELGHSLHLRHLEDEPANLLAPQPGLNLMRRAVDLDVNDQPSQKQPSPLSFTVLPFQVEAARRYGRCAGRFLGAARQREDDCPVLLRELGLTE